MAEKKEFKAGLYAVIVGVVLAVVLAGLTVFAFVTRYTGYSPEKVAATYVDTIVQTGDGYNAYKNTLVSENKKVKYGDFIRRVYMRAYINEKDENGKDIPQAAFVGTGSKEEQEAIDKVYGEMYDYYVELLSIYGWDNYGDMFDNYFEKLREVRQKVYGDEFMNYDYMFGALEANVAAYGESLTGVERQIASDNKTILREESVGAYQQMFGTEQEVEAENIVDGKKQSVKEKKLVYKLTTTVKSYEELSADEVKAYAAEYKERVSDVADIAESRAEAFSLEDTEKDKAKTDMVETAKKLDCSQTITNVAKAVVEVKDQNGNTVATQELYLAKIGNCWYVDNTNIDTTGLYLALE